jgi:hypothetical protein
MISLYLSPNAPGAIRVFQGLDLHVGTSGAEVEEAPRARRRRGPGARRSRAARPDAPQRRRPHARASGPRCSTGALVSFPGEPRHPRIAARALHRHLRGVPPFWPETEPVYRHSSRVVACGLLVRPWKQQGGRFGGRRSSASADVRRGPQAHSRRGPPPSTFLGGGGGRPLATAKRTIEPRRTVLGGPRGRGRGAIVSGHSTRASSRAARGSSWSARVDPAARDDGVRRRARPAAKTSAGRGTRAETVFEADGAALRAMTYAWTPGEGPAGRWASSPIVLPARPTDPAGPAAGPEPRRPLAGGGDRASFYGVTVRAAGAGADDSPLIARDRPSLRCSRLSPDP